MKFRLKSLLSLLLVFLFVFSLNTNNVWASNELSGKVIIVDAGHGGADKGAVDGDTYEKDIALTIALKVKRDLQDKGATVLMTRDTDYCRWVDTDINSRVEYIKRAYGNRYHAIVSIHLNSWIGRVGPFYQDGQDESRKLAYCIGCSLENLHEGNFAILRDTPNTNHMNEPIPKVLVETARITSSFVTSSSWQNSVATNISNGLSLYFNTCR